MARMRDLRERLHKGISSRVADVRSTATRTPLPNTPHLSFSGIESNRLLEEIGLKSPPRPERLPCRHCYRLHVLEAMQVPIEWAKGTLRFSIGRMTTVAQIDRAVDVVASAAIRLRSAS
jgi:cysteine desulfurase